MADHGSKYEGEEENGIGPIRRLLIIGAGPTSLGALYRFVQLQKQQLIGKDVELLIVEQEMEVGGLARSVTDEHGFTWDLGVHVMGISKYQDFVDALAEFVAEWRIVPRCAMADMSHVMMGRSDDDAPLSIPTISPLDCYVPYPVQNSIPYFPEELKRQCLEELADCFEVKAKNGQNSCEDFDEFSMHLFGPTLQRIFIRPYNEKVWTVPLAQMGISWLQGRVPLIDFDQLSRRSALPRARLLMEDGQRPTAFRYPDGCRGVGEMWRRFGDRFGKEFFRLGHRVISIDPKEKSIKTVRESSHNKEDKGCPKNGQTGEEIVSFHYDWLISTMPLTELGKMSGLAPELPLKYSTVILVGIGLFGDQSDFARQLSWAYYPRPEIIFYRCTILSNFSPEMVPQGGDGMCEGPSSSFSSATSAKNAVAGNPFWSVLCEIGQPSGTTELPMGQGQRETIVERVIQDLIRVGILRSPKSVCSNFVRCLPFGYPIPTRDRDQILAKCHSILEDNQIYSRGRFGGWRYEVSNQDHSFQSGLELIDRLFLGIPEQLYSSTK